MLEDSSATLTRKCWLVGTKLESSLLSSVRTHTSTLSVGNLTYSMSRTRLSSKTQSVCVTICYLCGIPHSGKPALRDCLFSGKHIRASYSIGGLPVAIRPHFVVFPQDESAFAIDDQFFIGSSGLLVKPVTEKGATKASVYLPGNQVR